MIWPTAHLPPKTEPTMMEQEMVKTINAVKAWRDCEPGTPFPVELDMQIDAMLTFYELRRK